LYYTKTQSSHSSLLFPAIGDISPFSYFKDIAFSPRIVYPAAAAAPSPAPYSPTTAAPPPPPAAYPTVNLYSQVLPQSYESNAPLATVESTLPPVAQTQTYDSPETTPSSTEYVPNPPSVTPAPEPEPEPAPAQAPAPESYDTSSSETEGPEAVTEQINEPSQNVLAYRWRQVPKRENYREPLLRLTPYETTASEDDYKVTIKYVPNFITSSPYQPTTTESPAPPPAAEPIFYFRDQAAEEPASPPGS
jgi:hypothetical protein